MAAELGREVWGLEVGQGDLLCEVLRLEFRLPSMVGSLVRSVLRVFLDRLRDVLHLRLSDSSTSG